MIAKKLIDREDLVEFLHKFRTARYAALQDAENFQDICLVIEEFGYELKKTREMGMGGYKDVYLQLFDFDVKIQEKIEKLFTQIKDARNDKAHRGPFARSVVKRASEFALFAEGELAEMLYNAEDFMSDSIVFARERDYLYKIRGAILENSYSYIPIQIEENYYFVSDFEISKIWMKLSKTDKYSKRLGELIRSGQIKLLSVEFVNAEDDLKKVMEKMEKSQFIPILVKDEQGDIVGIITAFDLL